MSDATVVCPYCFSLCTHETKMIDLIDSTGRPHRTIQVWWNCAACGGGDLSVKLDDRAEGADGEPDLKSKVL